jgi:hypothetical protein
MIETMDKPCGNNKAKKRDEWEVREDVRSVERAMEVFKDKERLTDVQEMIKADKAKQKNLDSIADGNFKEALGLE